jgi:putative membrane protein
MGPAWAIKKHDFIVFSIVLAIAAFWQLLEWWIALIAAPDVGTAFLGSQGDIWDAQWDMFLALIGAVIAVPLFFRLHDRSMARLETAAVERLY